MGNICISKAKTEQLCAIGEEETHDSVEKLMINCGLELPVLSQLYEIHESIQCYILQRTKGKSNRQFN